MTAVILLVVLGVALAVTMAGAWAIVLRTGKSGWTDAFWSFSTAAAGVVAALVPLAPGEPSGRGWLAAAIVAVWGLRLGSHITRRTLGGGDDPRYAQLKREWGPQRYRTQLLLFLEIQAACALVLVAAIMAAAHNPAPTGIGDALGVIIAIVALVGEGIADAQLTAFRRNPANKGRICDVGLWSLSRHPNYFFEWLIWLSYVPIGITFAAGYPWGWATLLAPALMYALLRYVSGVPPLEAHMLRSRGGAFRAYQQRVNAFWPVPK